MLNGVEVKLWAFKQFIYARILSFLICTIRGLEDQELREKQIRDLPTCSINEVLCSHHSPLQEPWPAPSSLRQGG